jgi:hypothetical protein
MKSKDIQGNMRAFELKLNKRACVHVYLRQRGRGRAGRFFPGRVGGCVGGPMNEKAEEAKTAIEITHMVL